MTTSKRSSIPAKSGKNNPPDRQKGLAHFRSMLTLAITNGDHDRQVFYRSIIKRLESLDASEKKK